MSFLTSFGKLPDAQRRQKFGELSIYQKRKFQNLIATPALAEGENMVKLLFEFFQKHPHTVPDSPVPFVETDLKNLHPGEDTMIWFGHSSYFLKISGKTFLIDPVFSGNASPIPNSLKAFEGSDFYQVQHFPKIDYLLITHDHWDHLDFKTIQKLKNEHTQVICCLGVAQHFEHWGWNPNQITEKAWWEEVLLDTYLKITFTPARHFSGRGLKRNSSLWTSFVLESESHKLFLGGDSGYGTHFKEIGKKFGTFDLAVLECGQYNKKWPYIHSFPEQVIQESLELQAKQILPVHHSKFKLSDHPWYEPLEETYTLAQQEGLSVLTPKIGEQIDLRAKEHSFSTWWKAMMPDIDSLQR